MTMHTATPDPCPVCQGTTWRTDERGVQVVCGECCGLGVLYSTPQDYAERPIVLHPPLVPPVPWCQRATLR